MKRLFNQLAKHVIVYAAWCTILPGAFASLQQDVRQFAGQAHRLTGSEEAAQVQQHLLKRLEQIGPNQVITQPFLTTAETVKRCEIVSENGTRLTLHPMRPNGIIQPVTPVEGITGPLVYCGMGTIDELSAHTITGRIVVLDYNAGDAWMRAIRYGAKAIIFVAPEQESDNMALHYLEANCNIPRFYYAGPATDLLALEQGTIHSSVTWERVRGQNIYAFFEGTDPEFYLGAPEVVLVGAPTDSYGAVPHLSPAARQAANMAGLLQLAEDLKKTPPRRNVLLAFFDSDHRAYAGTRAFYRAIEDEERKVKVKDREGYWEADHGYNTTMLRLVQNPMDIEKNSERLMLIRTLSERADYHRLEVRNELYLLRKGIKDQEKNAKENDLPLPDFSQQEAEIERLDGIKQEWNDIMRFLSRNQLPEPLPPRAVQLLDELKKDLEARSLELGVEKELLQADKVLHDLLVPQQIVLHLTLGLGDQRARWGFVAGGDTPYHNPQDNNGLYSRIFNGFLDAWEGVNRPATFEPSSINGRLVNSRSLWGTPLLHHSGEIATLNKRYSLVACTIQDRLPREGTPADTVEKLNLSVYQQQLDDLKKVFIAALDSDELSVRSSLPSDKIYFAKEFRDEPEGTRVMGVPKGGSMANKPIAGAIVQIEPHGYRSAAYNKQKINAFEPFVVLRADQNGSYEAGPLPTQNGRSSYGFAARFDEHGLIEMAIGMASFGNVKSRMELMHAHAGLTLLPPLKNSDQVKLDNIKLLDADSNAALSGGTGDKAYFRTVDGVSVWYVQEKIENLKLFSLPGNVALMNDTDSVQNFKEDQMQAGVGFPVETPFWELHDLSRSGENIWQLNESRLQVLRDRNIINSGLEELHGRSGDLLDLSKQAEAPLKREAFGVSSMLSAIPVYENVLKSMDDLVKAVLILLALCVPFAFALEKLIIGSSNIYRQVGWFSLFFTLTFLLLYFSHPAFAIAKTPAIIFLGFTVIVLAGFVIFILVNKFETEIKALQGMSGTVHAADISRSSTIAAAINMGISTMRRRPLRTALTAVTIVLLTFTILSFASFDTQKGIIRIFLGSSPNYTGAFLHDANWREFDYALMDVIEGRWGEDHDVYARYWHAPKEKQSPELVISLPDGSKPVALKGMLGLDPGELEVREDLKTLLGKQPIEDTVFITRAVAESLGLKEGDQVLFSGLPLQIGKVLQASDLTLIQDMDGNSVLPVDFVAMQEARQGQEEEDPELANSIIKNWSNLPIDSVAIVSQKTALRLNALLYGIHIYTDTSSEAVTIAEDAARMIDIPVAATREDGVYRHLLGTQLTASGLADLLLPVILGGLVIFGTMLGSVSDREKEIYTFSALGLAPPHVASLFFAEAAVYSVIGGLSGYLLAQGTMSVLTWMAQFGWVTVPEMNYSSTNAIVTILIVMATVMISAIYPAVKASKSANPGLLRSWKLEPPEGDEYDLVFPFTVSDYDITGVVSFLKEHFDGFTDAGLGKFMAKDARIMRTRDGRLGVASFIALAPFDLGVTQQFELTSAPSDIEGIDEVRIKLLRLSGQRGDWVRQNKVFFDDLRTQFLLWRSLPAETMEKYRNQTLQHINEVTPTGKETDG